MAFMHVDYRDVEEPDTFEDAWNHPDEKERMLWHEAIKKEFKDMNAKGV